MHLSQHIKEKLSKVITLLLNTYPWQCQSQHLGSILVSFQQVSQRKLNLGLLKKQHLHVVVKTGP